MKPWIQAGLLLAALIFPMGAVALPTFEPFADATSSGGTAYANGAPLAHQTNAGSESWSQWDGGTYSYAVICTNAGLSYGGFPPVFPAPSPTHAVYLPGQMDHAGGYSGLSAALTFSHSITADPNHWATNTIYASFLLKVSNLGNLDSGSPIYFAGFATNTGDQNVTLPASAMKIYLKGNSATAGQSTSYLVGVANNSGYSSAVWDNGGHTSNDVLFVVVEYEFGINGNADTARLWVNPGGATFGEATPPAPSAAAGDIAGANRIGRAADFFLLARSGKTLWGSLRVGDLRIGESWSYVTGGPEIVPSTGPVLSIAAANGGFVLSSTNGRAGATNIVLSNTNLSVRLTHWTAVTTNQFDDNGHFQFTNALQPAKPVQFFALRTTLPAFNSLWVPTCGAWLGAAVTNGTTQNFSAHETKIGRLLDVLRIYHTPGSWTQLTTKELNYIDAGRKLLLSVKPSSQWSNAVGVAYGGSATVDAQMASLAQSIASIKPYKIMLIVWHEPENDVIGGGGPGNNGTPTQYVEMWHNVRNIFDANGATNVIWCWCIQNIPTYRNLISSLWPGNSYVDWVMWDAYADSKNTITNVIQGGYNWLLTNSDSTHDYAGKPWGLAEWGVGINNYYPTVAAQTNGINQLNAALNVNDQFPRLKLVSYFDELAPALLPGSIPAYSNFVHSPYMTQQCSP